jgi:acetolactate synthase regulatory subunit
VRVLTLLRRRQCRVVAVHFHEADRHGPGWFELTVLAPPRTADRVDAWLLNLVDVNAVLDADAVHAPAIEA